MAAERPSLLPVVGPDGLARDAPVISYTEKVKRVSTPHLCSFFTSSLTISSHTEFNFVSMFVMLYGGVFAPDFSIIQIIEEEQLQLKRYINENYSKIRDVERELENLTLELKLTAGPKRAALEHLRKKIELSTERIHAAKLKEDQARKAWEAATKIVKDEEAVKQKLCEDLNHLVQESAASQFSRLEELKKRLEALNPSRTSNDVHEVKSVEGSQTPSTASSQQLPKETQDSITPGVEISRKDKTQQPSADAEGFGRKRIPITGRGKGIMKNKGSSGPGWTGAGFDVDGRA